MNDFEGSDLNLSTLGIVMGGGAGMGLFPLTRARAKPAVPLAGKYRLVDIPLSNCINSGIQQIYVLTQYCSAPLNRHITNSYRFDCYGNQFVDILAAQQTPEIGHWYQGTADAVRQNLSYFTEGDHEFFLIVSGDHLYRMDFRNLLQQHVERQSDITIATTLVGAAKVKSLGIVQTDEEERIVNFVEKPADPSQLKGLEAPSKLLNGAAASAEPLYQANMGIYVFNREVLVEALNNTADDFGRHIIPDAISKFRVDSYLFDGYWENIGNIGAFFEANLAFCGIMPSYDFFESQAPIYTHSRFLPATKINGGSISETLMSDGCILSQATIERCILGLRTVVEVGTVIRDCVILGANYYGDGAHTNYNSVTIPGIGKNCRLERAIIDKNVSIGDNVVITSKAGKPNYDHPEGLYYVRDGVVVIPKDTAIPDGMVI